MSTQLTEREHEILNLIFQGFTNKAIAEKLFVSVYTVETHRKNLNHKLSANNTAILLANAMKNNYLP